MIVSAASAFARILAYNAGVTGSIPVPPTFQNPWSELAFAPNVRSKRTVCLLRVPHMFRMRGQHDACSVPQRTRWSSTFWLKRGPRSIGHRERKRCAGANPGQDSYQKGTRTTCGFARCAHYFGRISASEVAFGTLILGANALVCPDRSFCLDRDLSDFYPVGRDLYEGARFVAWRGNWAAALRS